MWREEQGLRARACMRAHTHTLHIGKEDCRASKSESERARGRARAREHKKYSQTVVTNIFFLCVSSHAGQRGMPGGCQ